VIQDLLTDPWPALRGAALRSVAAIDREGFVLLLSGLDPDPHWTVRAVLADVLGTLPAETSLRRLQDMLGDEDKRVVPPVLAGLVRLRAPDIERILLAQLKDTDAAVREAAARHLGELKAPGALDPLREAYTSALSDSGYGARAAAVSALAAYGADAAGTLKTALGDKDWAVRVRAAQLLARLEPSGDHAHAIRPAPAVLPTAYEDPRLVSPANSPHAFIDTAKGTIEIELAVLDAPQTARNFMALAGKGFFNGLAIHRVVPNFVVQDGDPRGDGGGGPGYSIRDELNDRPYVRGTVGMALSWRDTGGSQFFITHSPQPHLDGRYTAFGHVVSGMEVVDRIQQGDVIQRVRIWDGKNMSRRRSSDPR
jgi:cyclophilin family peptidyl-prolyl cis-trans isomerase